VEELANDIIGLHASGFRIPQPSAEPVQHLGDLLQRTKGRLTHDSSILDRLGILQGECRWQALAGLLYQQHMTSQANAADQKVQCRQIHTLQRLGRRLTGKRTQVSLELATIGERLLGLCCRLAHMPSTW